jgi:hypothetical protein
MAYPKVQSVRAVDDHTLLVEFANAEKRLYDIRPLLERETFYPLRNYAFFKNVQVDESGYAVFWNDEIDLSEYELWIHGKSIDN